MIGTIYEMCEKSLGHVNFIVLLYRFFYIDTHVADVCKCCNVCGMAMQYGYEFESCAPQTDSVTFGCYLWFHHASAISFRMMLLVWAQDAAHLILSCLLRCIYTFSWM